MDVRKRRQKELSGTAAPGRQQGFTLIEIVVAIVVLAGALVTLLGLQSAIIRRTAKDTGSQRAMMYARQILAAVESLGSSDPPVQIEVQDETGPVIAILEGLVDLAPDGREDANDAADLRARLLVEPWGIAGVHEEAMKRITVEVWSERTPDDLVSVVYFIPNESGPITGGPAPAGEAEEEE